MACASASYESSYETSALFYCRLTKNGESVCFTSPFSHLLAQRRKSSSIVLRLRIHRDEGRSPAPGSSRTEFKNPQKKKPFMFCAEKWEFRKRRSEEEYYCLLLSKVYQNTMPTLILIGRHPRALSPK